MWVPRAKHAEKLLSWTTLSVCAWPAKLNDDWLLMMILPRRVTLSHFWRHAVYANQVVCTSNQHTARQIIPGGPKWHSFLYALTSSDINQFSKLFHCQNQEKTYSNTITKDPTTPQVCRYTTLWNVKCLKSNNWKQGDSCNSTLKLTTGNNVFTVYLSYCLQ